MLDWLAGDVAAPRWLWLAFMASILLLAYLYAALVRATNRLAAGLRRPRDIDDADWWKHGN